MVGKQLQPPSSSSNATTGSKKSATTGSKTSATTASKKKGTEQVAMHAQRTTKVYRRGAEWESDSEYVSTVETNKTTTTASTGTNIATTESQL
ncbi:hypothetical protein OSTOST_19372, partial [Ostertagia ostertagi]